MTNEKILEIANLFKANENLTALEVMEGYIFGTYGNDEHYPIDEIANIKQIVYSSIQPPVETEQTMIEVEEPVAEEPTLEEIILQSL